MKKLQIWLAALIVMVLTQVNFHAHAQKKNNNSSTTPHPPTLKTFQQQAFRANDGVIHTLLRDQLHMKVSDQLIKTKDWTDDLGHQHFKYQQQYRGIKVAKSTYSVHARKGYVTAISGDFLDIGQLNTTPTLDKSLALRKAASFIHAQKYTQLGNTELVISRDYIKRDDKAHLAYRIVVIATNPESHNEIFVDAHTGQVLLNNPLLRSCFVKGHKHAHKHKARHKTHKALAAGQAITLYSGTQTINTEAYGSGFRLFNGSRGDGIHVKNSNNNFDWDFNGATEFVDNDNNWTAAEWNNAAKDAAAMEAFWAYEKTYDYFKNTHNRNSVDNNGKILRALIHSGNNWSNAQYSSAFVMMRFGDGNTPLTTMDITAHELTHGVTDFSADLVYTHESGALNEAFSDIFAAAVEATAAPTKETWLMGDDIGHIRSMSNPKSKNDPDTYKGTYWHTSSTDNGGVHTNSGVLNHWFYLLSVGKSGTNDNGDSYNVAGITIDKAAKIAYRMLTVYLSANSQYADARTAGIQSAKDLYGAGSNEEMQTTNAFYAIGVGAAYGGGNPGGSCVDAFPYSESFESGLGQWKQSTSDDINWTRDSGGTPSDNTGPSTGSDGSYYMYVEASNPNFPSKTATLLSPCFDISALNSPTFKFDYHMYGSQINNLKLEVSTNGSTWTQVFTKSGDQGNSWASQSVDLKPYQGNSVSLRFTATTGASSSNGWQSDIAIDHVRVEEGSSNPPTAVYCDSKGNNVNDEFINRVQIGSIDNTSGANAGYGNFTAQSTSIAQGGSTTITITPAWPGSKYNEAYSVWIDFNRDGDFTDAGEQVFTQAATQSTSVSGTINIPSSALAGNTRMRVSMKYNGMPTSCETFNYGEVEDYTINIGGSAVSSFGAGAVETAKLDNATAVFPNPARSFTQVKVTLKEKANIEMSIINAQGKVVASESVKSNRGTIQQKFNLSELPAGIYLMRVTTNGVTTTKRFVVNK